jgi:hypothetical protein
MLHAFVNLPELPLKNELSYFKINTGFELPKMIFSVPLNMYSNDENTLKEIDIVYYYAYKGITVQFYDNVRITNSNCSKEVKPDLCFKF